MTSCPVYSFHCRTKRGLIYLVVLTFSATLLYMYVTENEAFFSKTKTKTEFVPENFMETNGQVRRNYNRVAPTLDSRKGAEHEEPNRIENTLTPEQTTEFLRRKERGYLDLVPLSSLVNYTRFLTLPTSPCNRNLSLVVLVSTACNHVQHRQAIRETWATESKKFGVPVVFFTGRCPEAKREMDTHGDTVEADFLDTYYNLSLKTFSKHRWFKEHCSVAQNVLMADDDVLVNVKNILASVTSPLGMTALCFQMPPRPVNHFYDDVWYVPSWVYREYFFPPYCAGPVRLLGGPAVLAIQEAVQNELYYQIEDALFTGSVRINVDVNLFHDWRFFMTKNVFTSCQIAGSLATHAFPPAELRRHWQKKLESCKDGDIPSNGSALSLIKQFIWQK